MNLYVCIIHKLIITHVENLIVNLHNIFNEVVLNVARFILYSSACEYSWCGSHAISCVGKSCHIRERRLKDAGQSWEPGNCPLCSNGLFGSLPCVHQTVERA